MPGVPRPPNALIGREAEVAAILHRLVAGSGMVTITGRAGVGKSRVAMEVLGRCTRRAVFVDASTVADRDGLAAALHDALGLVHDEGSSPWHAVVGSLRAEPTVVVLDDATPSPGIGELRAACPGVWLVTVAPAPLGLVGESLCRIDPLPVPPLAEDDQAALLEFPAVRLLCDVAAAVDVRFSAAEADAPILAEITRRLEGLPLAIELVAARLGIMSPRALLAELSEGAASAVVGEPLRRSIERAMAAVADDRRQLLRSMAVFDGPVSIETVHAVGGVRTLSDTIDSLSDLVDTHLVDADLRAERARFRLSPSVRAVVLSSSTAAELDAARRRRAHHYLRTARRIGAHTVEVAPEPELADAQLAAEWLLASEEPSAALKLSVELAPSFFMRGDIAAGADLLRRASDAAMSSGAARDVAAHIEALVWMARFEGDHRFPPDRASVGRLVHEAFGLVSSIDDAVVRLDVLRDIARRLPYLDDPVPAVAACQEGLRLSEAIGDELRRARFLILNASVLHMQGDIPRAAQWAVEAAAIATRLDDPDTMLLAALVLQGMPRHAWPPTAIELPPQRLLSLAGRLGSGPMLWTLANIAGSQMLGGLAAECASSCRDMLSLAGRLGYVPSCAQAMMLLSLAAARRGELEQVAQLDGQLARERAAYDVMSPPHFIALVDVARRDAAAKLGADRYAVARAVGAGRSWAESIDHAVAYAVAIAGEDAGSTPGAVARAARTPDKLTRRELQVLRLLAEGGTNKSIASALGLRSKTVMHHNESIFRKLGVRGRAAAVSAAHRRGLLDP